MGVEFFAPFSFLTTQGYLLGAKEKCVAYVLNGRIVKRCGTKWTLRHDDLAEVEALQAAYQRQTHIDARRKILFDITQICLCDRHHNDDLKAAAVQQWEDELASRASNPHLAELKTPKKKSGEVLRLKFEIFTQQTSEDDATRSLEAAVDQRQKERERRAIDRRVIDRVSSLEDEDNKKSNYLYILGHTAAKGLYKVGSAKDMGRLRKHRVCYPGYTLYTFTSCPRALVFEKQVHAEFSQQRRWHICEVPGCKTEKHGEWFEAPLEDILSSVGAWSFFARTLYRDDISINRSQPTFPWSGYSSHPHRWHTWAQEQAEQWIRENQAQPHTVRANPVSAHDLDPNFDRQDVSSPVPGLSHSPTQSPDSVDGRFQDPATPTPLGRGRRGRHTPLGLAKGAQPVGKSNDPFSPPITIVGEELLHGPQRPVAPFDFEPPSTPPPRFINVKAHRPATTTPISFAGIKGETSLSQNGVKELGVLELADLVLRCIFFD
ncbi:GIY-YIG nuclease family protein [Aspergillus lucknowensis]|uniref:Bacteriophage T5 Orf172 DNA-binding domain-containing protein n=1 Tax=Aspergillus lucknowensis TaxID=176173 RepID=A0ABR4M265_9EURO